MNSRAILEESNVSLLRLDAQGAKLRGESVGESLGFGALLFGLGALFR